MPPIRGRRYQDNHECRLSRTPVDSDSPASAWRVDELYWSHSGWEGSEIFALRSQCTLLVL